MRSDIFHSFRAESSPRTSLPILSLMTACAVLLMEWVVRGGCEVSEDSMHYLTGAPNLAESGS